MEIRALKASETKHCGQPSMVVCGADILSNDSESRRKAVFLSIVGGGGDDSNDDGNDNYPHSDYA